MSLELQLPFGKRDEVASKLVLIGVGKIFFNVFGKSAWYVFVSGRWDMLNSLTVPELLNGSVSYFWINIIWVFSMIINNQGTGTAILLCPQYTVQQFSPLSPSITRAYVLKSHDLCNIFHSGWLSRSDSFHIWNEGSCLLHPSRHQHACHPRHACPRSRLLSWPLMHLFIKHSFPMFYISVALFLISPPLLSYLTVSLSHCSTLWLIVELYLYFYSEGSKTSPHVWLMYYSTRQESSFKVKKFTLYPS